MVIGLVLKLLMEIILVQVVNQHLKQGTAKLLVDTEETLMYELGETKAQL